MPRGQGHAGAGISILVMCGCSSLERPASRCDGLNGVMAMGLVTGVVHRQRAPAVVGR